MGAYEYDDFLVKFSPHQGGGYTVRVRAPDGRTASETFQLPFTADELKSAVRTIGYTRSARDIGDVAVDPRLSAEQFGDRLAKALLEGPVGKLYIDARNTAVAAGRGVRMWLSLGKAPGLTSVPWEFLYLQPTFLASQRKTPIVRFLLTDAPVQPRHIETSVEMLGVIASPTDLPPLDVEEERKRVDDALAKVRETRDVKITWLDPATKRELRLALQKGDYHILHFVGHSGFTGDEEAAIQAVTGTGIDVEDPGGVIYLEDENHLKDPISDAQVANLLGDLNLRLVVLNSCEGARSSALDPFAGLAPSIVGLGIPAVLAMQFEISDKAAIAFADELYQSLLVRQEPIDVAVAEARKAVFNEVNETEWATPVLFLRNEDGRIFDFGPTAAVPLALTSDDKAAASADAGASSDAIAAFMAASDDIATDLGPGIDGQSNGPSTGPTTKPVRRGFFRSRIQMHWVAPLAGVAVLVLALGGVTLGQLAGGQGAAAPPPPTTALASPTAPATVEPSVGPGSSKAASSSPTASPPSAPPSFRPLTAADLVAGITPNDLRWIGPRLKSNMLAVAGGPTTDATNVSAVDLPQPGATASPATQGSNAEGVVDYDPAWDPQAGVLAFAREQDGRSWIRYVVPKTGLMPDGNADTGISVKDVQAKPGKGRYDHAPAWRGDRNLLFARAPSCPDGPGPGCREDIRLAKIGERRGDYFQPVTETALYSQAWGDVRNIAVDPRDDGRILVTGTNLSPSAPTPGFGVWLVFGTERRLLSGSETASRAIFASDGSIIAIETGSRPGWGPAILQWPSSGRGDPTRIDVATIVGAAGAALPADTEFASISLSPTGDGRFAVLATDRATNDAGGLPKIAILDREFNLIQAFDPVAPTPPDKPIWNVLTGLAW